MKDSERNIMYDDSLRKCPYSVPEGYFDSLKERAALLERSMLMSLI